MDKPPPGVDPVLETRRTVAQRGAWPFAAHPAVSAVLVTGSVALGRVDQRSDVDMLVVCRDDGLPLVDRAALLTPLGTDLCLHDQRDDNALFPDRDSDGRVDGVLVTVCYQTVPWIDEILDQVLAQGAITTARVPFRPYTLPALLQRAWVLADNDGAVERWRQRAAVFPGALKRNLIAHFAPRLRTCVEELVAGAERRLGPRHFLFFLDRAVDAVVGTLFALNDTYDPADRRTERVILPTLPRVPQGFIARLIGVLEGPFDDDGALHRAYQFEQLASAILDMAAPYLGLSTRPHQYA
jgi:hypothetical protein